jgi:putative acetyltransferase
MEGFVIEPASAGDLHAIASLYRSVAAIEGGLARTAEEITEEYAGTFVARSLENGILLIARRTDTNQIIGEIHAYTLGPKVFAHVLGELTIAVDPSFQGTGVGKALFSEFLELVKVKRPDILRVELIARESNQKAIRFYEKMGFQIEGKLAVRIRSVEGGYEADIPMGWLRKASE